MNFILLSTNQDNFTKWTRKEWTDFFNSDLNNESIICSWDKITELIDNIGVNLEDKKYGIKYPEFQQLLDPGFCGWEKNKLAKLIEEIETIEDELKKIPIAYFIKRKEVSGITSIKKYNLEEIDLYIKKIKEENTENFPDKTYYNIYDLYEEILTKIKKYITEAKNNNENVITTSGNDQFNTYGTKLLPRIVNPFKEDPEEKFLQNSMSYSKKLKNGARWFYWIAGLSILNTIILLAFKGQWNFIAGLGITQIIDTIFLAYLPEFKLLGIVSSTIISGLFFLFGFYASKEHYWAFITGIVLYSLDGLVLLAFQEYIGAGFHAFALVWIIIGLVNCVKFKKLNT